MQGKKYDTGKLRYDLVYWPAISPVLIGPPEERRALLLLHEAYHAKTHGEMVTRLTSVYCILSECVDSPSDLVRVLEFGAQKYDPWNWSKGMKWSRLFQAAFRHLVNLDQVRFRTDERDVETDLPHFAHAMCCIMFLIAYALEGLGEDDRPCAIRLLSAARSGE